MSDRLIGMIDAGFLREAGARALKMKLEDVNIQPKVIVDWLDRCAARVNARMLRCYWYDAILQANNSPQYVQQRQLLDTIDNEPGMQVRLGSLVERPRPWENKVRNAAKELGIDPKDFMSKVGIGKQYEQKGVDTLIVMDLVRLAQQNTYNYVILFAGDRDLAEAVKTAQDLGRSVLIAAPADTKISPEIERLSDETLWITDLILKRFLTSSDPADDE